MSLPDSPIVIAQGSVVCPVEVKTYPGGEPLVNFPRGWGEVSRVLLRPRTMTDFFAGLFFVDALKERGFPTPKLILPLVPGSRQDRVNGEGDYLFTAKSIAKEVNVRRFPLVTILDPHSDVVAAMIDHCDVIPAVRCVKIHENRAPEDYAAVVSPDAGAEKRASAFARWLKVPLLHGWKTRDVGTGAISGFGLEPSEAFAGQRVLVVDDLCDGGGTFLGLSEILSQRLLRPDLYVTHGLFSQGTEKLKARYFNIVTTDSTPSEKEGGIVVEPVCEMLMTEGTFIQ